jgi:glycosyltransferase involved in cell wall biosynthesis
MKVLVDYHHHDLWESLELLFARLGWELYRPIGMEWFHEGYWNFERAWHGDAVAKQYLEPWGSDTETRFDPSHNRHIKLLTLQQARDLRPDIVMSSVAHNHEGLARFAREVGAKFGLQLGNVRFSHIDMAEDRWDLADFGLVSAILPGPVDKPHVVYHQEFDLEDFRPEPPLRNEPFVVSSFVNCFPENTRTYAEFRAIAAMAPDFDWRVYGAYGGVPEDEYACGNLQPCSQVGSAMRDSDVAWHTKQWSDGFGHVIHNWFAVGRPVFGYAGYYASQLAGPLWVEGVTSFDLEGKSPDDVVRLLAELRQDEERHLRMSEAAAARFREVVNFDDEAEQIRAMFAQVLP